MRKKRVWEAEAVPKLHRENLLLSEGSTVTAASRTAADSFHNFVGDGHLHTVTVPLLGADEFSSGRLAILGVIESRKLILILAPVVYCARAIMGKSFKTDDELGHSRIAGSEAVRF